VSPVEAARTVVKGDAHKIAANKHKAAPRDLSAVE
jgi:hypothetical protein